MSLLFHDLRDVLVRKNVVPAHTLGLVFDGGAPDPGVLELRHEAAVDAVAEVLHGRVVLVQDDGRGVVRDLALGLGVDADHLALVPHLCRSSVVVEVDG